MRSPLVAVLLGLSLVACEVGEPIDGGGGGGGGGGGPDAAVLVPRVDIVVDKPTLNTELKTSSQIMITVAADGGFSGQVNLAAALVDAANAPITGWTVALNQPSVTLTANGTASAVATLQIPSDAALLTGRVKITATSSLGPVETFSSVTALNQLTFEINVVNADCVYPTDAGGPNAAVRIRMGTKVRFFNKSAGAGAESFQIHSDNGAAISHQGQAPNGLADLDTEPNSAYEQTLLVQGATFGWYCHDIGPNTAANPRIQAM